MNKKTWIAVHMQTVHFEKEDVITTSVTIEPGENELPVLPVVGE